jgi:hypothetical protein
LLTARWSSLSSWAGGSKMTISRSSCRASRRRPPWSSRSGGEASHPAAGRRVHCWLFNRLERLALSLCSVDPSVFLQRCPRLRKLVMDCY